IEREEGGRPVHNEDGSLKTTGRYLFTTARISAGPERIAPTLAYKIEETFGGHDAETGEIILAPRVVWDPTPVTITAAQAITSSKETKPQGPDVRLFLKAILAGGPMEAKKIEEHAAQQGISTHQLNRMKTKLGVRSEKTGFGSAGEW